MSNWEELIKISTDVGSILDLLWLNIVRSTNIHVKGAAMI